MYQIFPLLAISLAIYTALSLTGALDTADMAWHQLEFVRLKMASGVDWSVKLGDVFLLGSMGLLFAELLRATKTGTESIMNHAFSFVVFFVAFLMFLFLKEFANSVFFLYLTMTLLDFMAGFIVTTVTARRDLSVGGGPLGG
ncbi:MAG: hypothetical protein R3C58_02145 [Parvularculaceae bacterium]